MPTTKFSLFYTFIPEKRDKFFLRSTAIIFFRHRLDAVFCFYCATQRKKETLVSERNIEDAYTTKGFSSWKKAPQSFEEHQQANCYKSPVSYHVVIPKCKDVCEMTNGHLVNMSEKERKYLLDVIMCLRYLARQGTALQGNGNNVNFTQLMMLLGTKDGSIIAHLDGTIGNKYYTHHDIQNELLNIMSRHVLFSKLKTICKKLTAVNALKDILLRLNLRLQHCRGQTYNGARNMMGEKSGVATKLFVEQPKALVTYCQDHSLSLAVKDLTACDTMSTMRGICVLVKYSPKRENILGRM